MKPLNAPGTLKSSIPHETQRFGFVAALKSERAAYYKELHANPWPGICQQIHSSHIRNYSIYLKQIDGKDYLFSYFEYTGDNFEEDMKRMASDPETKRWWEETVPCLIPLPDAARIGEIWSNASEVFYLA